MRRAVVFVAVLAATLALGACGRGRGDPPPVGPGPASSPAGAPPSGAVFCQWLPDPAGNADPAVGRPADAAPATGLLRLTLTTNLGVVTVEVDRAKAPCTAASFAHLAGRRYFDGTSCHRLVQEITVLQCGDPTGTGGGGPPYRFNDEYLPVDRQPPYREGDVAMANTGEPGSNGSQFFFVYGPELQLPPDYTLFGRVVDGLDVVKRVAAAGDDGAFQAEAGGGHPNTAITFQSVRATSVG